MVKPEIDLEGATVDALKNTIKRLVKEKEALKEDLLCERGEKTPGVIRVTLHGGPPLFKDDLKLQTQFVIDVKELVQNRNGWRKTISTMVQAAEYELVAAVTQRIPANESLDAPPI